MPFKEVGYGVGAAVASLFGFFFKVTRFGFNRYAGFNPDKDRVARSRMNPLSVRVRKWVFMTS